jgi:hypothetical protein
MLPKPCFAYSIQDWLLGPSQDLLSRFDQKQMLASEGKSLQRPFEMLFRVKIKVASDFQPPRIGVTNQGFWNTS